MAYYQKLGIFIQAFAQAETAVYEALQAFAGVTSVVARAIFSGTRAEAAKQLITRIADAKNLDKATKEELKNVFDQLGEINSARNHIVHYGTQFEERGFKVSNALVAHLPTRIRTIDVSGDALDHMTADLHKISMHMLVQTIRRSNRPLSDAFQRWLAPILQRPWRYKQNGQVPQQ
jgi:hypothetical protein